MWVKNDNSNRRRTFWTRSTILFTSSVFLLLTAACTRSACAASQSSGVVEALQKKYAVTQMTPDFEQVTKDGTTMDLKCAGVYSLPTNNIIEPDNKVADGKIQPPSMFTKLTLTKMGSHVLQTGDKVYITKIDRKDESGDVLLRFTIVTVSALDVAGQDAQKKYKAIVAFKFKKGYLDDAPPDEVEQAVETIMAPDQGGGDNSQAGGDDSANAGQAQGPQQAAPSPAPPPRQAAAPPPPPPTPAGPPPTITIGESSTEVLQAMGMPLQMIDLGKKKTYVYKNMKVIFLNDKVSDVQ